MIRTEVESRISLNKVKLTTGRRAVEAHIDWEGQRFETLRMTKGLCVEDLRKKCGLNKEILYIIL